MEEYFFRSIYANFTGCFSFENLCRFSHIPLCCARGYVFFSGTILKWHCWTEKLRVRLQILKCAFISPGFYRIVVQLLFANNNCFAALGSILAHLFSSQNTGLGDNLDNGKRAQFSLLDLKKAFMAPCSMLEFGCLKSIFSYQTLLQLSRNFANFNNVE